MKNYILILLTVIVLFIIILTNINKEKIEYKTNLEAIKDNISKLEPFIKQSFNNNIFDYKTQYNDEQIKEIKEISNNIINNIKSYAELNGKYKEIIKDNIQLDIFNYLTEKIAQNDCNDCYKYIPQLVDFYISPIVNLENNNINVYKFLKSCEKDKCPDCDYLNELVVFSNFYSIIYNDNFSDNLITKNITNDLLLTSRVVTGPFINEKMYSFWNNILNNNKLSESKDYKEFNNLFNHYKRMKSAKQLNDSKRYLQLFITDDKNLNTVVENLSPKDNNTYETDNEIGGKERVIKELLIERNSVIENMCVNEKYLSENTVKECIDLINKSKNKEEVLKYVSDENIKDYIFINDKLCITSLKGKIKYYNNESSICKAVQNKMKSFK